MEYLSTTEKAKKLREYYKSNLGLTRNDVSVTKRHEGCIGVEMKKAFPKETMDKIYYKAKSFESVDYDEYTNEILAGGNEFVFVYTSEGYNYFPR